MALNGVEQASVSFHDNTKVNRLDSHTYAVHLHENFRIGSVINGGYTASCILGAATEYLSSRGQPDALTAHFEFPNRTIVGPAIVMIEDVKPGRQLSILHLSLWQGGLLPQAPWATPASRRKVLAYATFTNLRTSVGISIPTGYEITPAAALKSDTDRVWGEEKMPKAVGYLRSLRNWRFYSPRGGPPTPGVLDLWVCLANGDRITQGALAYVTDSLPHDMHHSLCPVFNKKPLPEEGVEWLAVRVSLKQIKNGRFDLDLLVRDAEGELVALSQHVAMIVSMDNNTGKSPNKAVL
ncbi:thioesterase family protein [Jackrogersella minutella]|nr:thioesterase family protein [Jackrogersella minutella]